jgi:hypothetical protein
MEPRKSRVRRIRVHALFGRPLALPFLMVVASCALNDTTTATTTPEPSEPAASQAASKPPKRLTCPNGEFVGTDGGLLAAGAKLEGTETAGEAVEKWMASQGGADYVLTDDASGAWVLRADGTARAKVNLLLSHGWVVHGYQACS